MFRLAMIVLFVLAPLLTAQVGENPMVTVLTWKSPTLVVLNVRGDRLSFELAGEEFSCSSLVTDYGERGDWVQHIAAHNGLLKGLERHWDEVLTAPQAPREYGQPVSVQRFAAQGSSWVLFGDTVTADRSFPQADVRRGTIRSPLPKREPDRSREIGSTLSVEFKTHRNEEVLELRDEKYGLTLRVWGEVLVPLQPDQSVVIPAADLVDSARHAGDLQLRNSSPEAIILELKPGQPPVPSSRASLEYKFVDMTNEWPRESALQHAPVVKRLTIQLASKVTIRATRMDFFMAGHNPMLGGGYVTPHRSSREEVLQQVHGFNKLFRHGYELQMEHQPTPAMTEPR